MIWKPSDASAEVAKVTNNTVLLDANLVCQSVLLAGFVFVAWSTASVSTILGLPDLAWLLRFLQSEQNFLKPLNTVLWSKATSHFARLMFLFAFVALWPNPNW